MVGGERFELPTLSV